MKSLNKQKYVYHNDLGVKLVDTFPLQLYEGNLWGDTFWGIDLDNGKGHNHLGKILMEIRGEIMEHGIEKLLETMENTK